jgi:hypothetical protein
MQSHCSLHLSPSLSISLHLSPFERDRDLLHDINAAIKGPLRVARDARERTKRIRLSSHGSLGGESGA